jgi:hypothetical protein
MRCTIKRVLFAAGMIGGLTVSCVTKKEIFVEPQKDLDGAWRISKVLRNAADITPYVDSTGFRLTLQKDKSYTLEMNHIPFVVNNGGTWSTDDPQYPYLLSFLPKDSTTTIKANVGTPVSGGLRNLQVTFSPGCHSNTYVYIFEKLQ